MPVLTNFGLIRMEDGVLTIAMVPSTPIGGWNIEWNLLKRFGGVTPLVTKSVSSGYNGVSGISIVDSGVGVFNIAINSADTSGLDPGNYANGADRLTSGRRTSLTQGYLLLGPSTKG